MSQNEITWNGVMSAAMKLPGIKVHRNEYLTSAFAVYGSTESLVTMRPIDIFGEDIVEKAAKDAIKSQTLKVTSISTLAGIPGGFTMLGTIPADLAQYYYHVLVVAQKLCYIYGWPDLVDENGDIGEGACNVLTLFVGVMLGAQAANKAVSEIAKNYYTINCKEGKFKVLEQQLQGKKRMSAGDFMRGHKLSVNDRFSNNI